MFSLPPSRLRRATSLVRGRLLVKKRCFLTDCDAPQPRRIFLLSRRRCVLARLIASKIGEPKVVHAAVGRLGHFRWRGRSPFPPLPAPHDRPPVGHALPPEHPAPRRIIVPKFLRVDVVVPFRAVGRHRVHRGRHSVSVSNRDRISNSLRIRISFSFSFRFRYRLRLTFRFSFSFSIRLSISISWIC